MRGTVTHVNRATGRIAVQVEDGSYGWTVAGTEGVSQVQRGDVLVGELRDHGDQTLRNASAGGVVRVYVQAYDAGSGSVAALLGAR